MKKLYGLLGKVKNVSQGIEKVLSYATKADKTARTASAFLKHLKAFNDERMKIWGVTPQTISTNEKEVTSNNDS